MGCVNESDLEISDLDDVIRLHPMEQHVVEHAKFFEPFLSERERESRSVNRKIVFLEDVRKSPDVILVTVGQDQSREVIPVLFEKIEVRDGDMDPVRSLLRKAHAGVDDDHLIAVADAPAIQAELADAAQGDYFYLIQKLYLNRQCLAAILTQAEAGGIAREIRENTRKTELLSFFFSPLFAYFAGIILSDSFKIRVFSGQFPLLDAATRGSVG